MSLKKSLLQEIKSARGANLIALIFILTFCLYLLLIILIISYELTTPRLPTSILIINWFVGFIIYIFGPAFLIIGIILRIKWRNDKKRRKKTSLLHQITTITRTRRLLRAQVE